MYGVPPANDNRYPGQVKLMQDLGATFIHVFRGSCRPTSSPPWTRPTWSTARTLCLAVRARFSRPGLPGADPQGHQGDHRPHLQSWPARPAGAVLHRRRAAGRRIFASTNARHPGHHDFTGKHLRLTGRTAAEVAMAQLVDGAMDYELRTYGRRHLYCHTSWTHVGPVADRPDLEVSAENVFLPDMGDLVCLNIYTYANGVRTSPPGSTTGTTYQGYLEQLAAEMTQPILVTQVGLSTSPIAPKPHRARVRRPQGGGRAQDLRVGVAGHPHRQGQGSILPGWSSSSCRTSGGRAARILTIPPATNPRTRRSGSASTRWTRSTGSRPRGRFRRRCGGCLPRIDSG